MNENDKQRRLKKYEADLRPVAHTEGELPLALYSPFGPWLAGFQLPEPLLSKLNRWLDEHLSAGDNTELVLPQALVFDGVQSLADVLCQAALDYLQAAEGEGEYHVRLDTVWVVSQHAATASPVHFHSSDMSGVLYLKVPPAAEDDGRSYISGRRAGCLNLLSGGKQSLSKNLLSLKPEPGAAWLFPGWLLHGVEPFDTAGERRSLGYNLSYRRHEA